MLIVDDFLDDRSFLALRAALQAPDFPWESTPILSGPASSHLAARDNEQYVHGFYLRKPGILKHAPTLVLLRPLLDKINPASLLKAKANRTPCRARHIEYGLHVDTRRRGATTAIYYLNTNNGYTRFADGTLVASVENRLVMFDAALRHTGASCTDVPERLVLNLNLMLHAQPQR